MSQKYLAAKEVAERYNIGVNRVYDLIHQGIIPAVRLGKIIRIPVDALEEFEAKGGAAYETYSK